MQNDLMPNLKENIVMILFNSRLLEKDLNTKYIQVFLSSQNFHNLLILDFTINQKFMMVYFVGAGTHPGAGVPGVLSSAKVLDKII